LKEAKEINIKGRVILSLFWKFMERGGVQGIQFILQIVLARLLLPEQFGIIAIVTVFITISNIFVQSGFNTALIQKKDADDTDFSSVFYLSLFVAILQYIILYTTVPYIAAFYHEPQLIPVLRVLAVTLFLGAINSVQNAVISRKMDFKKLFFSSFGSIIISGTVGIVLAYAKFNVWALVAQQITQQLLVTVILWFTVKWRPKLLFSFKSVKRLFSYGWKLVVSSLVDTLYMNLDSLIIGKMYSSDMLAFFNRGKQFPALIVSNINGTIKSVMLPAIASQQDNRIAVKNMVRRSIVTSTFLIFPMMVGLATFAEPLVKILLTEKWISTVPYLQIYCAIYALWPIHTANLQAINALGRSDIYLKLEIIKKIIGLAILGVTVFWGLSAIALGVLASGIISTFINAYPNLKLLNYSYKEQIKDILPSLMLSLIMGIVIFCINFIGMGIFVTLIIQIIIGVTIYFAMAWFFKLECFTYLLTTFFDIFISRKRSI
jgi:teichuronic acid exporter